MILIDGMHGLGDNIYQRAVLREYVKGRDVYLVTSWPQLYADLPVKCVRNPGLKLRTQNKNANSPGLQWHNPPAGIGRVRWHYVHREGTILQSLIEGLNLRLDAVDFSGPPVSKGIMTSGPYVVVRPATIRTEWRADSRNPNPEYLAEAAQRFRDAGYKVVSVADLKHGEEWALDPMPPADFRFHDGELNVTELLSLVAGASAVVGGVGWLAPAAVAYQVPMFLIFGGWGLHNGPGRIFDPRMPTGLIDAVLPDQFCMCGSSSHQCTKTISNLGDRIEQFIARLAD